MRRQIQPAGFYLAGLLCLIFAVLKLATGVHWSWWRVMLPLWVVAGHLLLYIVVGFLWLTIVGSEHARTGEFPHWEFYQLAALLCLLGFLDNLLRRVGPGESAWWWLASGRWEVMLLFGGLSLGCQVVFWWRTIVVESGD